MGGRHRVERPRGGCSPTTLKLEVTAGAEVAFAYALLKCDTEEAVARNPDNRLRLTVGLRKEGGRWVVSHEHHSFPDTSDEGDLSDPQSRDAR